MHLPKLSMAVLLSPVLLACATTQPGQSGASPTVESISRNGAYAIRSFISFPDAPEYGNATIYYPLDSTGTIGGVAIVPGFTETQRHINWWGSRLASHGYAVLVMDTNDLRDRPDVRGVALMAGVRTLRNENSRRDSPLYRKIDTSKMSVMGHSMGGGGALHAANLNSGELSAAIPFTSWQPSGDFSSITVPTLVIAGEADTIAAAADHARPHYNSIPAGTQKVFLEVADGDHFVANNSAETLHGLLGSYAIAWLKLYMDGDERYRDFIYGDARSRNVAAFSRYEMNR
jgi:dienelactone hydrolase